MPNPASCGAQEPLRTPSLGPSLGRRSGRQERACGGCPPPPPRPPCARRAPSWPDWASRPTEGTVGAYARSQPAGRWRDTAPSSTHLQQLLSTCRARRPLAASPAARDLGEGAGRRGGAGGRERQVGARTHGISQELAATARGKELRETRKPPTPGRKRLRLPSEGQLRPANPEDGSRTSRNPCSRGALYPREPAGGQTPMRLRADQTHQARGTFAHLSCLTPVRWLLPREQQAEPLLQPRHSCCSCVFTLLSRGRKNPSPVRRASVRFHQFLPGGVPGRGGWHC